MGAAQACSHTRETSSRNTPKMEIPAAYAATLAHVRAVFPGALIAGGCLRDLDNDRPVKDIDIFAPHAGESFEEARRLVECLLPSSGALTGVMGGYENWATDEVVGVFDIEGPDLSRSDEHTSELQSLMRISYAVFCLKKKTKLSKIRIKQSN